jgi:Transposase DDE domain
MGMRAIIESIPTHVIDLIQKLRGQLCDLHFTQRHRVRPEDFTRERQLTFPVVMLFVLQKTVKSIQCHLHEFLNELAGEGVFEPVTAGAWTHARAKLRHTAFIELNQTTVLPSAYGVESEPKLRRWRGHRLLGVDSSLLRLPRSPEMLETFGAVEVRNHLGATGTTYAEGRMSVLYDLLNRIGLDGRLESSRVGEVELAIEQLRQAGPGDVLVNDRGFTGYAYLAWHHQLGLDYIARCSSGSFAAAQELFRLKRAGRSKTVRLLAPADQRAELRAIGLPLELTVRFVSVRLPTGELEVLATSLLDEQQYPSGEFLNVYHCRWNHETFYGMIKGRLDLENFSGQTVEAVRQDFFATLLLCNLESVLTESAGQVLREQSAGEHHPRQVNHAVAFHALKDQLLELLYSELPIETVVERLQIMFVGAPVSVRSKRKPPRKKLSMFRSYHFQRRVRKIVF